MAKTKESYGYAIVGQDTGKVYKKFNFEDIKEEIRQRLNISYIKDELLACLMFNASFQNEDEMSQFFINICINRGIAGTLAKREISVVKFFKRTKERENDKLDLNKNLVVWIKPEESHLYSLPVVSTSDFSGLFGENDENSITLKDLNHPLLGLVKLGDKLASASHIVRRITKEEAEEKNLGEIYDLYEEIDGLKKSKSSFELREKNNKLQRNLTKMNLPQINYSKMDKLYDDYDSICVENFSLKTTSEQLSIIRRIGGYFTSLLSDKELFGALTEEKITPYNEIFTEVVSYLNQLVRRGPYYYESFDRDAFNSADSYGKMKIISDFFGRLKKNGELSNVTINNEDIDANADKYLLKMLEIISKIEHVKKEEKAEKGPQRTR